MRTSRLKYFAINSLCVTLLALRGKNTLRTLRLKNFAYFAVKVLCELCVKLCVLCGKKTSRTLR